jgi:ELWxxDGT repeat protein
LQCAWGQCIFIAMIRLLVIAVFFALAVNAQPGLKRFDIKKGPNSSFPRYLTPFGSKMICFANDSNIGWEPYIMDTGVTVSLVADINTQSGIGSIATTAYKHPAAAMNGKFYFNADSGNAGAELYVYDNVSVQLAADIETGAGSSYPDNLVALNGALYFKAKTAANGYELWKYEASSSLATRLTDINPGPDSSVTGNIIAFKNNIYFTARTAALGNELYIYEPVADTAYVLSDINPGTSPSDPQNFVVINSKLYFSADDGLKGRELYVYDSINPPARITDLAAGFSSGLPTYEEPIIAGMGGMIYFSGRDTNNEFHLFAYDTGTTNVTLACKVNNTGSSEPLWLTAYGNKLYFTAYDSAHGVEIWAYDGSNPPVNVIDLCPGNGSGLPSQLTVIGNDLWFRAFECTGIGEEIFKFNYIAAAVKIVGSKPDIKLYPNPANTIVYIEIALQTAARITVALSDISGELVYSLPFTTYTRTENTINIPLQNLAVGTYYYRILDETGSINISGRLLKY